jgi:hypothetical protein
MTMPMEALAATIQITRWDSITRPTGDRSTMSRAELAEGLTHPEADSPGPGWAPVTFTRNYRKLGNVETVHALAWDYDSGAEALDAIAARWAGVAGVLHTTKRHTPEAPRARVILWLSRPVTSAEFVALWQALRARSGDVDEQTKDPSRFWYWPTMGEHFSGRILDGAPLDVDAELRGTAPQVVQLDAHRPDGGQASREKRARAWVAKADPAQAGSRGHQALWHVARKLVCDFELPRDTALRILEVDYNPRCEPPWSDKELAHKVDQAVTRATERHPVQDRPRPGGTSQGPTTSPTGSLSGATYQASVDQGGADSHGPDWQMAVAFTRDLKGGLRREAGNVALYLSHAPEWQGVIRYNRLGERIEWARDAPQGLPGLHAPEAGLELADDHLTWIQHWLARVEGVSFGREAIAEGVRAAAQANPWDPLRDYLEALQWDGIPRVGSWLVDYLGVPAMPYAMAVGRWWAVSAVARALRPGCQADHALVLEGLQGAGKSTTVGILAAGFGRESMPRIQDRKAATEALAGAWIVEIPELDALKGAELSAVKTFLTERHDRYRAPYDRCPRTLARRCVFVGTTNEDQYLGDPTGNRRFWPVRCGSVRLEALRRDRDQLWAEARCLLESGSDWWPSADWAGVLQAEQGERLVVDDRAGLIAEWIEAGGYRTVTSYQVASGCLGVESPREYDKRLQSLVGASMRHLGWERRRIRERGGGLVWVYHRPDTDPDGGLLT